MRKYPVLEFTDECCQPSIPEKKLLAAVLELAVRELYSKRSLQYCKRAASWFLNNTIEDKDPRFSFLCCVEYLGLSVWEVRQLMEKASEIDKAPLNVGPMRNRRQEDLPPTYSGNRKYRLRVGAH